MREPAGFMQSFKVYALLKIFQFSLILSRIASLMKLVKKIAIYSLFKNRNLQIMNCDYGCDVIITPLARNENRKLLVYLKKSQ